MYERSSGSGIARIISAIFAVIAVILILLDNAKLTVFADYGLTTLAYLLVGGVLVRLFRSTS